MNSRKLFFFLLFVVFFPFLAFPKVILYPVPDGEPISKDYIVKINGQSLSVYQARVSAMPVNQVWPGYQRPLEQTELASFCYFDADETVTIEIRSAIPVKNVTIRPLSYNIKPIVKGNRISFKISRPGQFIVEINGWHKALHMFVNPVDNNPPEMTEENVLYFGPGVYWPGIIHAKDNQTIYIAGGAVVHGIIYVRKIKNVKIRGRGIIDASSIGRFDAMNMIFVDSSENVSVEGVVLRDSHIWAVLVHNSSHISIDNIKLIGHWRYNADGIDIVNSQHATIKNSFVRAFDDCIVLKGTTPRINMVSDVLVDNCILWNDWGRALEIGAETATDSIFNVTFKNCDIIHYVHIAMDIQNGDRAHIYNIKYEHIRVEDPIVENGYYDNSENPIRDIQKAKEYKPIDSYNPAELGRLFEINIRRNNYSKDTIRGKVENVIFRNVRYISSHKPKSYFSGYSSGHEIKNILFEDVFINDTRITDAVSGNFQSNAYVSNLIFD